MRPFIFFTVILLLKSALAYFSIFDDGLSWTMVITEVPFFWLLFCLIELTASKRKILYYMIANLFVTAIMFAVIMYFKYYGVIVTYHALKQVNQVTAVKNSVFSLLDPYYLFIFVDIIVLGFLMLRKNTAEVWKKTGMHRTNRATVTVLLILSLALCFFNIYPNRASMNEIVKAEDMGIMNYEVYSLFAKNNEKLIDTRDITQAAIDGYKNIQEPAVPKYWNAAAGKNLIILQMESLQNFLIGLKIDGQEVTPNLNKLAADNFYFPHFFQQVGQGNTSDAEFVVNTSYFIPPVGAATQVYATKQLPSLPRLMGKNGYDTATFHTNVVEFWNRSGLYKALGWDRYYDQSWFGQEDSIFFGPSDEVLYKKTTEELARMDKADRPFYTQLISMTAHHPFTIPERKYKMTLPERYEGTFVGDYIRAQNYADYALGQFIDELKQNGLWDDSVLVIYGDHLGLPIFSLHNDDKDLMQEIYGHEYGYADMVNIPLIISSPGITTPTRLDQVGGQADILPTVANLFGISLADHIHFGQDLLNQTSNLLPERYYLPSGSLINDDTVFLPGTGFEDGENYPIPALGGPSSAATKDQYDRALKLLNMSDSYVSQLPDLPDSDN